MRHVAIDVDVRGADAETRAAKQMIDFRIDLGHTGQSAIVTTSFAKVVVY